MGWTIFYDYTDWKLLPLLYIDLVFPTSQYTFYRLWEGSTLSIRAITDDNDTGGKTITGYAMEVAFKPNINKLQELRQLMIDLKTETLSVLTMYLTYQTGQPQVLVRTNVNSVTVDDLSIWWEVDVEDDTVITFFINGIFSADLIDTAAPYLFTDSNM